MCFLFFYFSSFSGIHSFFVSWSTTCLMASSEDCGRAIMCCLIIHINKLSYFSGQLMIFFCLCVFCFGRALVSVHCSCIAKPVWLSNSMPFLLFFQHGHGHKGNKIYVSGPLLNSSNNVDQMLKDHDRKIQEFSRRARLDKTRAEKEHAHGKQVIAN